MPADFSPSSAPVWLGRLALQQDWFWFAALLLWGLALVGWARHSRRDAAWAWLPGAAGTGVLSAFAQFWIFNPPFGCFYERLVPGTSSLFVPALIDPNLFGDLLLALLCAALAAAWSWPLLGGRHAKTARTAVAAAGAAVVALHLYQPMPGAVLLALLPLPAAVGWWAKNRGRPLARGALSAAALFPLLSTVGPVATALHALQRSGPPTPFGLVGAVLLIAGALLALAALGREILHCGSRADRSELVRDAWPFALAALAWLSAGLLYAINTGRDNCDEVRTNRLRLVASRVESLDPALVRPFTDRRFHLDERPQPGHAGPAFSPYLATGVAQPAQRRLREIVQSTPFLETARFVVLRDGWLVAPASNRLPAPPGAVELLRRATPEDEADWDARRDIIERSPVPEIKQPYYCRAAVTDTDGRMLGWLEYVREEFYSTVERKWRAEPLLVSALGPVLAAILLAQRRSARAREAAVRAAAVADESSRLKTAFLAKVSHELRTPLQSILGYCELLQREPASPQNAPRLAALRHNGEVMLRLVNDLLDLGAIEAGAFRFVEKPVALAELVHQAVESLRPRAVEKGLALHFHADPRLPAWIASDPERLRQIAVNLVGNALKFTDRGRVDVTLALIASAAPGDRPTSSVEVEFAVADTGPGIPTQDRARLFQPFSRLDLTADKEGAGLGLALVAALCRTAGGGIAVESNGHSGSCFRARLPVRPTAAPAPSTAIPVPMLQGRRVLVADDNALVRELFIAWLTGCGAECGTATDGAQALAVASTGSWDALILDLAMPRLGGLEVARQLRAGASGRALRIVGVSAHARSADRDEALAAGMDAFLTKPVALADLVSALAAGTLSASPSAAAPADEQLIALFRRELPAQLDALRSARARADWPAVADRAHWLKNSAAVLRDAELFACCTALEGAADLAAPGAVDRAWTPCLTALARWHDIDAAKLA